MRDPARRSPRPIALSLASLAAAASLLLMGGAGPLTPPPGPVAPTHKTLTDVEPRTALRQPTSPAAPDALLIISQPGSYYLAGDLDAGSRSGIRVVVSDVRIDLNGFTIRGDGATTGRSGVTVLGTHQGIAVRNGAITHFTQAAVSFQNTWVDSAVVENLQIRQCGAGILNPAGYAGIYRNNTFLALDIASGAAIQAGFACLVERNQVVYAGATGFHAAISTDASCHIVANSVMGSLGAGIAAGVACEVSGNTVTDAASDGITAAAGTRITGNTIFGAGRVAPTGAGVRTLQPGATAEDNLIVACNVALASVGGCSFIRNKLQGNPVNSALMASDVVGPAINASNAATSTNPLGNILQ